MSGIVVEVDVPVGQPVLLPISAEPVAIEIGVPGAQGAAGAVVNLLYDSGLVAYPSRPAVASVTWIGPVDPAGLAHNGDLWINTA